MTDGFTQMIDDANAFFVELAQNNTKDWFNPRKEHSTRISRNRPSCLRVFWPKI